MMDRSGHGLPTTALSFPPESVKLLNEEKSPSWKLAGEDIAIGTWNMCGGSTTVEKVNELSHKLAKYSWDMLELPEVS